MLFAPGDVSAAAVRGDDHTRHSAHAGAACVRVAGGYGQGSRPVSGFSGGTCVAFRVFYAEEVVLREKTQREETKHTG